MEGIKQVERQYVWNIAEVVRNSPISNDQKLTRTFLVNSKYCTAFVVQAQPQTEPFIHMHKKHDEFLYILKGKGEAYIGGKKFEVKAGDLVYCPVGVEHGFSMSVKGVRLSIFGPPFDRMHPDRVAPSGKDLM